MTPPDDPDHSKLDYAGPRANPRKSADPAAIDLIGSVVLLTLGCWLIWTSAGIGAAGMDAAVAGVLIGLVSISLGIVWFVRGWQSRGE
jgi:hypothetical protein